MKNLTAAELVSTLGDASALVESGGVKPSEALALGPRFAGNGDRHVMSEDEDVAGMTENSYMPAATWPQAAAFIDKVFGPRARELGWEGKGGKTETHNCCATTWSVSPPHRATTRNLRSRPGLWPAAG